jgi:hypothetical protein
MGVPTSEVGYTSATTGSGDHEVHKGHVVALEGDKNFTLQLFKYNLRKIHLNIILLCRPTMSKSKGVRLRTNVNEKYSYFMPLSVRIILFSFIQI